MGADSIQPVCASGPAPAPAPATASDCAPSSGAPQQPVCADKLVSVSEAEEAVLNFTVLPDIVI